MILVALLWGFAEATLFFIVPDVLVSVATLRAGWRRGACVSLAAALAAALGGLAMMLLARSHPAAAQTALASLPAIDAAMIERVRNAFDAGGLQAVFAGAFSGIPYKIYAVLVGEAGWPLPFFVAVTPLVRLPRFLLTVAVTALVRHALRDRTTEATRFALLAAFWTIFYTGYFSVMP